MGNASLVALHGPLVSVVYMDDDGEIMWEEGVNYNSSLLAVPLPCNSIEEWGSRFASTRKTSKVHNQRH